MVAQVNSRDSFVASAAIMRPINIWGRVVRLGREGWREREEGRQRGGAGQGRAKEGRRSGRVKKEG